MLPVPEPVEGQVANYEDQRSLSLSKENPVLRVLPFPEPVEGTIPYYECYRSLSLSKGRSRITNVTGP